MRAKKLFAPTDDLANSRRYIAALIILQAKAPVHYSVLLATDVIWTDKIPTAATDGVYVYVSPDFFRGLANDQQRAFLLAHEVSHIILRHPQRGQAYQKRGRFNSSTPFDHAVYNRAADYVINSDCKAMGLEPIPEGCYSDEYGRNDLVDSVYMSIYSNQPDPEESDGPEPQPAPNQDDDGEQGSGDPAPQSGSDDSGESDSSGESQPAGDDSGESGSGGSGAPDESEPELPDAEGHDYHLTPEYEGDEDEQAQAAAEDEHQLRSSVDDGIEQLERDGGDKAGLSDEIREGSHRYRESTASDTDWRAELADRFNRAGNGGEKTWSRIHRRRYATLGVISPTSIGQISRLSIIVDISESVLCDQRDRFMAESAVMIDMLQPRDGVTVCWTNHAMHRCDEVFSGAELLDLEAPCGGGTYMTAGVEWLEQNGLESDLTLVFTDGDMADYDWNNLGQRDNLVVVLDREPYHWIRRHIAESGVDTIVAQAA
jgi:predicted metal-dependent peptidase